MQRWERLTAAKRKNFSAFETFLFGKKRVVLRRFKRMGYKFMKSKLFYYASDFKHAYSPVTSNRLWKPASEQV